MHFSFLDPLNITFNQRPEFYLQMTKSVASLGVAVNLFGLYIILYKSPTHFKTYKWHLANHQIWSLLLDLFAGLMITPVFFFPMPVGYPTGLLSHALPPEILMLIATSLLFLTLSSIFHLLFYRWQMVVPQGHPMKFSRTFKGFFLIGVYAFFLVPHLVLFPQTIQNQTEAKAALIEHYPIYESVVNISAILVFYLPTNPLFYTYMLVCGVMCTTFIIVVTAFLFHTAAILRRKDKYANFKTQLAHRKYIMILSTQMSIPMIALLEPGALLGLIMVFRIWNVQELAHLAFFTFASHGLVGTVTMLILNEHFKAYLAKRFCNARDPDEPQPISLNAISKDVENNGQERPSLASLRARAAGGNHFAVSGGSPTIRVLEFDAPGGGGGNGGGEVMPGMSNRLRTG
ncbi:unnamed protein product, partial [Mesorhabditis belari]|uniref:Uncharacterized protein n=1 Tax=Mesorhabditis belari TaxID=2138241 RepID=A0AAF3EM61_9BILA